MTFSELLAGLSLRANENLLLEAEVQKSIFREIEAAFACIYFHYRSVLILTISGSLSHDLLAFLLHLAQILS